MLLLPWEVSRWQEPCLAECGGRAAATSALPMSQEAASRERALFSLLHPGVMLLSSHKQEAGLCEGPARSPAGFFHLSSLGRGR